MKKKLEFQYFYRQDDCKAKDASDKECVCWHDEGCGPYKDERHDAETPLVEWRIKPSNAEVSGASRLAGEASASTVVLGTGEYGSE